MPDTQGIYVVAEKALSLPPFIDPLDDYHVEIPPSRLITWYPRTRSDLGKTVAVLELRNADGTPVTRSVGPATLHYWWLNIAVLGDEQQARKWAKWLFNDLGNPSRSGTLAQLNANNNVDHQALKGSPDLTRPVGWTTDRVPNVFDTYLRHSMGGATHQLDSELTSDVAINAEVAEKPNSSVLVDPKARQKR